MDRLEAIHIIDQLHANSLGILNDLVDNTVRLQRQGMPDTIAIATNTKAFETASRLRIESLLAVAILELAGKKAAE